MKAVVKPIQLQKRAVCISDIHGHLELFEKLLDKVGYTPDDTLVLLGDLFLKGPRLHDTLGRLIELSHSPNVHILRGNCDWQGWLEEGALSPAEIAWLDDLPHILDAGSHIFVHGGLPSENLAGLDDWACMKNDAFMEQELSFSRWVVTGHWPAFNYCHQIPCHNPIVNAPKRIIAIDGGCVIKDSGQLNAFLIENGAFSFEAVDSLPPARIDKAQEERGGTLNITWNDRPIEIVEQDGEFSTVRHIATGTLLTIPNTYLFTESDGGISGCSCGTDYFLPVTAGETVSLVEEFSDRILAKKNGAVGWILK